jgi:uncharacterized membrane protein YbhN (UPF0104 family)
MTANNQVENEDSDKRQTWKKLAILLLKIVLAVVIVTVLFKLLEGIDWSEVGAALQRLSIIELVALLVLLGVRQVLNAVPLSLFAPGMTLRQSVISDSSANLVATVAPPPGDVALRIAMFRSWKIPVDTGLAGLSLNTLIYYVLRFAAPVIGFLVLLVAVRFDDEYAIVAVLSGIIAIAIAAVLVLIIRAEASARWIGRTCARLVKRVRPNDVDVTVWSDKMAEFRGHVEEQMRNGWLKALVALMVMVVVEGVMILAALRFLGVSSEQLNAFEIVAAFCITYPLTALPFSGLGILDSALYAILISVGTGVDGPTLIAGLLVWRIFTLGLPLLLGGITLLLWRRGNPDAEAAAQATGSYAADDSGINDPNQEGAPDEGDRPQ